MHLYALTCVIEDEEGEWLTGQGLTSSSWSHSQRDMHNHTLLKWSEECKLKLNHSWHLLLLVAFMYVCVNECNICPWNEIGFPLADQTYCSWLTDLVNHLVLSCFWEWSVSMFCLCCYFIYVSYRFLFTLHRNNKEINYGLMGSNNSMCLLISTLCG